MSQFVKPYFISHFNRKNPQMDNKADKGLIFTATPIPNYMLGLYNFGYYFCLTPFRIEWSDVTRSFEIVHPILIHKVTCVILHTLCCTFSILNVFLQIKETSKITNNPAQFAVIMTMIISNTGGLCYVTSCWRNKGGLTSVCNTIIKRSSLTRPLTWQEKGLVFSTSAIFVISSTYNLLRQLISNGFWDGAHLLYDSSIFSIWFGTRIPVDFLEWVKIIAYQMLFLYTYIFQMFAGGGLVLFHLFIFYRIAAETEDTLKRNTTTSLFTISAFYNLISEEVSEFNRCLGAPILITVVLGLFSFSGALLAIFDVNHDVFGRLAISGQLINYCVFFCLGAEVGVKLKTFRTVLFSRRNEPGFKDNLETFVLISRSPLCLQAFRFDLTYGLIAVSLSAVITYAAVFLQFQVE